MGVFPRFGGWINQNTHQQPLKGDDSKKSENVKSKSASEKNTNEEKDEMKEQLKLWRVANKKKQWNDPPAKVTTEMGICHMHMKFTLGLPPKAAYDVLTNPDNQAYSRIVNERELLDNKSRKVVTFDGTRQVVESEKEVAWNFLSWSRPIPISLYFQEDTENLSVVYMKNKMKFMKVFDGAYKVEPIYVDSERLCKRRLPKSREEYKKCSGGQGRIASKVTMDQFFQPSSLFNLPPLSWYVRNFTIKFTKDLLEDLQDRSAIIRGYTKRSGDIKTKSVSKIDTNEKRNETQEQLKLWRDAEKKKKWDDAPAKVETVDGICFMDMEFTLGLPPQAAYDVLANPDNKPFSRVINGRELLHNKSRKVVTDDGKNYIVEKEKDVAWNFLFFSVAIPITLVYAEKRKDLSVVFMKNKVVFMKVFEGSWNVEPIFVDSERLCKQKLPKTREDYRQCSGGQGKVASKVIMDLAYQPSFPFNLPPLSWYIRGIVMKTTKNLIQDLQAVGAEIRGV
ncbi:unnamed protein product [Microthlaspi erraticum]|uniref:DUF220 domain-containing protein n=1 Tax=Microthlaspi erraticum TaxID=1685480 RepID=A0A6D2J514_9BRAS|nr:unnamed protein product [Microthlaspi erraticum]